MIPKNGYSFFVENVATKKIKGIRSTLILNESAKFVNKKEARGRGPLLRGDLDRKFVLTAIRYRANDGRF